MVRPIPDDNEYPLRDRLFELLAKSPTTGEADLKALNECASFIKNRNLVETMAAECGLKLARFQTNRHLEVYYDIKRGRHDLGFISKGWDEPGFRIGELIEISRTRLEAFKANAYRILRFCAGNGIVMTAEDDDEFIRIQVDGVIYSEGFNKDTFLKTLDTLNECVEKAESLLA